MEDEKYNINAGFKLPNLLTFIPASKNAISMVSENYLNSVLEGGEIDILQSECMLKTLSDIIESIRKNDDYKSAVNKESMKYPDKEFNYKRFKLVKSSTTKYEYDTDHIWVGLKSEIDKRQKFLQNLQEPIYDQEGVLIYPAVKRRTDYLKISPQD